MQPSAFSLSELKKRLQMAGVQPTAQRLAIYSYLCNQADHPTAEDIQQWMHLNFPKVSLATVYNTLKSLVEAGLLRTLRLPHSEKVVYDPNLEPHLHFLDQTQGRLIDLPAEHVQLSQALREQFKIESVQVLLVGTQLEQAQVLHSTLAN